MMSGVEWLYFPLSLFIGEFLLIKVIEILRGFFSKLSALNDELSKEKESKSQAKLEKVETKEKEVKKESKSDEVVAKDTSSSVDKTASAMGSAAVYTSSPYTESKVVHGNYLCDFFDYESNYVLSREQFRCHEEECLRKKRYSIMDEMDADHIDDKAYQRISEIINQNKQRQSVLDEFNGLSKEMKIFLINSMLNKKVY